MAKARKSASTTPNPAPEAVSASHPHPPVRPEIETSPTRCPACGSTDRERYTRTTAQAFAGVGPGPDEKPFTHIVRRWTRCAACGQARVDRSLENRIGPEDPDKKAATA